MADLDDPAFLAELENLLPEDGIADGPRKVLLEYPHDDYERVYNLIQTFGPTLDVYIFQTYGLPVCIKTRDEDGLEHMVLVENIMGTNGRPVARAGDKLVDDRGKTLVGTERFRYQFTPVNFNDRVQHVFGRAFNMTSTNLQALRLSDEPHWKIRMATAFCHDAWGLINVNDIQDISDAVSAFIHARRGVYKRFVPPHIKYKAIKSPIVKDASELHDQAPVIAKYFPSTLFSLCKGSMPVPRSRGAVESKSDDCPAARTRSKAAEPQWKYKKGLVAHNMTAPCAYARNTAEKNGKDPSEYYNLEAEASTKKCTYCTNNLNQ